MPDMRNHSNSPLAVDLPCTSTSEVKHTVQQQQILETVRSRSQAVLEVGECTAGTNRVTLQDLHSTLEGKPGRVSIAVCNTDLSEALPSVEGGLRDAGRPYVVVYAGQPDQVRITDFLTPTHSVATSADHSRLGLFFDTSSSMML